MKQHSDVIIAYTIMLGLIILVGLLQSWNIALSILCFCLISAVMTMGANIQWGYAGLINFGIMGYTALGGLAAVLVSVPPVREAWQAGGMNMILCIFIIAAIVYGIKFIFLLSTSSFNDCPEIKDIYPGISGKTQGDKKLINPAKKAIGK